MAGRQLWRSDRQLERGVWTEGLPTFKITDRLEEQQVQQLTSQKISRQDFKVKICASGSPKRILL